MVKHLPTMWKTQVLSLGREDPLEKEMATHSSTLAWKIPWMEDSSRPQFMGPQRVRHDWATSLFFYRGGVLKSNRLQVSNTLGPFGPSIPKSGEGFWVSSWPFLGKTVIAPCLDFCTTLLTSLPGCFLHIQLPPALWLQSSTCPPEESF